MKIEENCKEYSAYYIEFLTDNFSRKIRKTIVVKNLLSCIEIKNIVIKKFENVDAIVTVKYFCNPLLLKNDIKI
ncbi:hypothetical protein [Carnobacterium maltaromaticum]|uniref:hypothetical protein n=1 Tax=Carnobacterium maltaromaticum TaxID=2751 RepID=UPI00191BBB85|nr:hypothetical protein [Carnobacterium maltaromaticum]CAD5902904.1 conserved hypothetical protein [Carnobacterium maltaromaticum]